MDDLHNVMEAAQARQRDRQLGQESMFDVFEAQEDFSPGNGPAKEWDDQERLLQYDGGVEVLDREGPEVREVELLLAEHLENAGVFLTDDEHALEVNYGYECSHVIICSGEKVGTLKYRVLADNIEIIQLHVHPENQGKGLGTMVMERVLGWSKEKHKKIELSVLKANPARLLYERLGFSITGEDEYEYFMELGH